MSIQKLPLDFYDAARKAAKTKNKFWKSSVHHLVKRCITSLFSSSEEIFYNPEDDLIKFIGYDYIILLNRPKVIKYKSKEIELFPVVHAKSNRLVAYTDLESEIKNCSLILGCVIIKSIISNTTMVNTLCCNATVINALLTYSSVYDSKVYSDPYVYDGNNVIENSYIFTSTLRDTSVIQSNLKDMNLVDFDIWQNQMICKSGLEV